MLAIASVIVVGTFLYGAIHGQNPNEVLTISTSQAFQSFNGCTQNDWNCIISKYRATIRTLLDDGGLLGFGGRVGGGSGGGGGEACWYTPDECWEAYGFCVEICDETFRDPSQGAEHQNCYADCGQTWYACKDGIPAGCTP